MEVKVDHRRVAGVARSPEQLLKVERERVAGERGKEHGDCKPLLAGGGDANQGTGQGTGFSFKAYGGPSCLSVLTQKRKNKDSEGNPAKGTLPAAGQRPTPGRRQLEMLWLPGSQP